MTEQHHNEIVENEWTYLFNVETLTSDSLALELAPNEDERKRLSQRLGLLSLESLVASLIISRSAGEMSVHIEGSIKADLIQNCVVTLEPVETSVAEDFEAWFADTEQAIPFAKARKEQQSKGGHADVQILEEKDDPEPIIDGQIDLGELITQHLSLAINPYPHAEGVHFEVGDDDAPKPGQEKDMSNNPFAALKDWKNKLEDKE